MKSCWFRQANNVQLLQLTISSSLTRLGILDYGFFDWVGGFADCVSGCSDRRVTLAGNAAG